VEVDDTLTGDVLFIVGSEPFTIYPGDSVEVALALVGGHDQASVYINAVAAKERYNLSTYVNNDEVKTLPQNFVLHQNYPNPLVKTLPQNFVLHQNYPNPFNPTTIISFSLTEEGEVSLEVFNLLGQKVKTLLVGHVTAGSHTVEWDATDNRGDKVASGVYFYRLTLAEGSQTRKMVLLK